MIGVSLLTLSVSGDAPLTFPHARPRTVCTTVPPVQKLVLTPRLAPPREPFSPAATAAGAPLEDSSSPMAGGEATRVACVDDRHQVHATPVSGKTAYFATYDSAENVAGIARVELP